MINLIKNENMKIFKRKRTWIMVGVMVVFIFIQFLNVKLSSQVNYGDDWKTSLIEENALLQVEKESLKLPIEKMENEKKLLLNNYYIDSNIKPTNNAWFFTIGQSTNFLIAISILTLIIAGEIVASEFQSGTIKFLLTRTATRTQIYFSKYISTLLFGFFLIMITFLLSILFSGILLGFDGINGEYLFVKDHVVQKTSILQALIGSLLFKIPYLIIVATLAFMISAAFKSSTFSIVFSLLVAISGFVMSISLKGFSWTKYFIFSHTDLSSFVYDNPPVEGMTFVFSILFILIHIFIMHGIAYPIFVKKDVA
ncbi:ABC transporter permease [Bacillus cereus]|uniref:ABC transporter permease n=1 Tax=unclassified Bacillus (in: firmicutes) TaxID=185979 RepID=UPI00047B3C12|nr:MULTISPECIES: ABC transporter permease subunit [unclassified Bacillus (in: firmicutes)]PFE03140.1 ABC transporter permease [Bacillus sp. AFS023182]PGX92200.1 ABC transporter permease [Bacillus cereus]SDY79537.1 ABC-2 type transport system permease protein [Bacillus sp. 166amftsu]